MSALANYLRNKIIDWYHRGQSFTPPTSVWIALYTTAPSAAAAGTEVSTSGTGYGRIEIPSALLNWAGTQAALSTVASSGTTGNTSNNSSVNFGTATTGWGTISHWEAYDAVTGGNRQFFGTIVDGTGVASPRTVAAGDPVSFPASALVVNWS